ncbi:hypothetical protein [Cellulomonas carbonis]|uniref:Aminoglycoside phosphotransferase domain-containing protein n=1 Tax=Cellulomonas carbonis T26 TaxID=947969 RepID=A0A0A0BUP8_9CELL|nr:hypothetical protein [Cellulomonas carbonis]KGM11641.1 hypothetical protein N868_08200 [Cellulomonas carbonis T26]GGC03129.1 hypothetical protein GCM10010972_15220 [Cellulomonas carbonis]
MSLTLPGPALPAAEPTAASARAAPPAVDAYPMPAPGWGVAEALEALAEARLALPLPGVEATVVSALTTVVLRVGDVAVKVYPPGTDREHVARIATALAGSDTALLPLAAPVVTSWGVVSVSSWLTSTRPVDWLETGALLRRFHVDHADADVAAWDPLRRVVTQVAGLADDDAAVLLDARTVLLDELARLDSPLGVGVVHGDVSPLNVMHAGARAVLIDLDFVARAPLEYDLSSPARRADSGEIDAATYLGFCRAYGTDVRAWDGRVVLDRIAQLGGVAFRLWDDRRLGRPLDWVADAVRTWRTPL